ncbi:MAG: thymidylate kinase [Ruminococcaceae bacterium]|nr:thymidylate kinase [Oscillospiraceae bacterium]
MMGKLIVIEGVDASGKATQTKLLYEYLLNKKGNVLKIEFPDYESPSSSLVKMYLNGEFGENADDVNPYVASTFFAADRFASYKTKWEKFYKEDYIIVLDRYVTANMIHQASKFNTKEEKEKFINWLCDYEYGLYSLPQPDIKIFLDVPVSISRELMKERLNKFSGEEAKDIHERDEGYLEKTYENAKFVAENYGFNIINCVKDNKLRTIDDIQEEIRKIADGI